MPCYYRGMISCEGALYEVNLMIDLPFPYYIAYFYVDVPPFWKSVFGDRIYQDCWKRM